MTPLPIDVLHQLREHLSSPRRFHQRAGLITRNKKVLLRAVREGVGPELSDRLDLGLLIAPGPDDWAGNLARKMAMLPNASTEDASLAWLVRAVDVLRRLSAILTARRHEDLAVRVDVKVPRRIWEGKTTDMGDFLCRIGELHPDGVTDAEVEEMIRVGPLGQLPGFLVVRARRLWLAAREATVPAST